MAIIRYAIRYPITVSVGVILVAMFGLVAFGWVPVQMKPDMDTPSITVQTIWPGASPQEIEREIVDEQEDQLKNVDGLLKMESQSQDGVGTIVLEFPVATDLDAAMLRVSNALEQVPTYPADAEKPVLFTVDANMAAVAWFVITALPDNNIDVENLYDFLDDEVRPLLERVPGVAQANVFGGREREMQVIVDPDKLAVRRLTLTQVAAALSAENRDYSAGDFDEGKRRYVVRTTGDYRNPEDVMNVIVATVDGAPIFVRDIGTAQLGYRRATSFVRHLGQRSIAMNCLKESGVNILTMMEGVRRVTAEIDADLMRPRGLIFEQVYDETEYIDSAITLVRDNILIGGSLAIIVLLLFLRSASGTFTVALSIPISVVATFLVMALVGRSINVISLAGLAFAVGMVVDNCIVVIENIFRHREMGKRRRDAALDGAVEVWGAVLASTLTTVAVFLPVIFVQEEAGQLFRDIAIAISAAVLLSLAVSMTVIPTLTARILGKEIAAPKRKAGRLLGPVDALFGRIPGAIGGTAQWLNRTLFRRLAIVGALTALSVVGSWALMPKAEYLPSGNSNFILGLVLPPPGYNLDEMRTVAEEFVEPGLRPYWELEKGSPEALAAPAGGLRDFFYVGMGNNVFMGMRGNDDTRTREFIPTLQQTLGQIPGAIGIATQPGIFQQDLGVGRSVSVDIRGPELEELIQIGQTLFGRIMAEIPGVQARPVPSLDLGSPEIRLTPDRRRMADVGLTNRELGFTVNALVDGAKVSDYRVDGREIDLVLKGKESAFRHGHELEKIPINTPTGDIVTLGSVAQVEMVNGPQQLQHLERQRGIRLLVVPPDEMPLEEVMTTLEAMIEPMRASGSLPLGTTVKLAGTADDLTRTRDALLGNFLLALAITYLLMAALFQSWVYPLVILFSVPLAALGGFIGLRLVNFYSVWREMGIVSLDVLTMLGFVILIGIVVNNAILIVHQSLNLIRDQGMSPDAAIPEAVKTRVRPIFMSTATSIFGMLPLVLFPGAGSELYRGLGSVVIGGLAFSTVFTLVLVPALFSLTVDARRALARLFGRAAASGSDGQATPVRSG